MLKPLVLSLAGMIGLATALPVEKPEAYPSFESRSRLIWKTEIGLASFRSNVLFHGNRLYIGSNGDGFMDAGVIEPKSGVYAVDRKSGKIIKHFGSEMFGDMDVNGLLVFKDRLYFGNDNEEFLCTDLNGKILWRNATSGDIEHEPSLLKTKKGTLIVYAAESGEVKAVDPVSGKTRWAYYMPEFDGWKPGDNRALFKVKAWFSNPKSFFTKPLLVDINGDATEDLVYCLYRGDLLAINGSSGQMLWEKKNETYAFEAIGLLESSTEKYIVGIRNQYDDEFRGIECVYFSRFGKWVKQVRLEEKNTGGGLNILPAPNGGAWVNGRTKTFLVNPQGLVTSIERQQTYIDSSYYGVHENFRNGFSPLFGNQILPLANGKKAIVVMNQKDFANYDTGFLEILSLNDRSVIDRISFPQGSEMPPVIHDVDQDGDLDILISSYDGYLYCYELPKY